MHAQSTRVRGNAALPAFGLSPGDDWLGNDEAADDRLWADERSTFAEILTGVGYSPEQLGDPEALVDDATRAAWADLGDPAVQSFWTAMERLTPDDRAVIKGATGYTVPARGSGARPMAPMLAFAISMDRKTGILWPGLPLTASYFRGLLARCGSEDRILAAEYARALAYVSSEPT